MKFSLVMGTYGRDKVLRCFLDGLKKQTYHDFKFIVVDQNADFHIKQICDDYSSDFEIQYLRADKPGLSHARNIGLKYVSGDIFAFPDDDCEYPPDLLSRVNDFFTNNREYHILSCAPVDTVTSKRFGWFLSEPCILAGRNILKAATSFGIFIKIKDGLRNFDEQFGIGASFGSAEEIDYIFRYLQSGYKGYYDPRLEVYHQERNPGNMSQNTFYQYSLGLGAYLRKHTFFGRQWSLLGMCLNLLLIRPVGGMLVSLMKLDWNGLAWYWAGFKGKIKGFTAYNRNCFAISKSFE